MPPRSGRVIGENAICYYLLPPSVSSILTVQRNHELNTSNTSRRMTGKVELVPVLAVVLAAARISTRFLHSKHSRVEGLNKWLLSHQVVPAEVARAPADCAIKRATTTMTGGACVSRVNVGKSRRRPACLSHTHICIMNKDTPVLSSAPLTNVLFLLRK